MSSIPAKRFAMLTRRRHPISASHLEAAPLQAASEERAQLGRAEEVLAMILMRVKALAHDPEGQAATLILEDLAGDVALGFVIPMNEANRLARALGLTPCQRAPIYELLHDVLREVRGVIARAVLDHEPGGVCAALVLEHEGTSVALPCHPADAVALAVRTGAPIYATAAALARGCVLRGPVPDGSHDRMGPPRPATTAEWLERVRPADFGSTLPACDAEP